MPGLSPSGGQKSGRLQQLARFQELLPGLLARIEWSSEQLANERTRALRELVAVAREKSPWHRERLIDVDPQALTEADLVSLPAMTKNDLMDNFDEVVTDRRVTRELCETYLSAGPDEYLLDEYRVVASGGSSGRRGVFVYGWDAWVTCYASIVRFPERDWQSDPELAGMRRVTAVVGASDPTHMSAAFGRIFSTPNSRRHVFPVSQPLDVIVEGLNDLEPTVLMGYSSILPRLAAEARDGRLRISPRRVVAISEPLLPEARDIVERTWGAPVASGYGMSEGVFTGSCGLANHLPDDLCLFEPVTVVGVAVPSGQLADRVLVTNLYNTVLPLIRYEVTDEVVVLSDPCPCGSSFARLADPQGRLDDTFVYDGIGIHPHVFRSALAKSEHVVEYQVTQTPRGADIRVVADGDVECEWIRRQIEHDLRGLGIHQAEVTVAVVTDIDRHRATGKLRRFVPLAG